MFLLLLAYCIFWPLISPYDPYEVDFAQRSQSPSLEHPFGTDQFGRDLFTRTALGGRVSIGIGFAANLVILAIGVTYGSLAGFLGGVVDNVLMRILDALYGLPYLPFAIIVLAIFGGGKLWTMVIALSDRIVVHRGAHRPRPGDHGTKDNDYVRAAHAVGARPACAS